MTNAVFAGPGRTVRKLVTYDHFVSVFGEQTEAEKHSWDMDPDEFRRSLLSAPARYLLVRLTCFHTLVSLFSWVI